MLMFIKPDNKPLLIKRLLSPRQAGRQAGRRRQSVLKSPITQPLYKRQYIYTAPVGVDNCAFLK